MLNYVMCLFNNSKCVAKLWKQESPVKFVVVCLVMGVMIIPSSELFVCCDRGLATWQRHRVSTKAPTS